MRLTQTFTLIRTLLILGAALSFSGCETTTHDLDVISFSNQDTAPIGNSYLLKLETNGRSIEDSPFAELEVYVNTALSGLGLIEATNFESADMVIEADYKIKPPRKATRKKTVIGNGAGSNTVVNVRTSGGAIVQVDVPNPEHDKEIETVVRVIIHETNLRVTALEKTTTGEETSPKVIWSVFVTNEALKEKDRPPIPVLMSAVVDYIGVPTKGKQPVTIDSESSEVEFIRNGY